MEKYAASAPTFIALAAALGSSSVVAVSLRLLARWKAKLDYGLDDLFAIIALILILPFFILLALSSQTGLGYSLTELPIPVLTRLLKLQYATVIFCPAVVAAARYSLLCLYRRIFSCSRTFEIGMIIVTICNTMFLIGATLPLVLSCVPVKKAFHPLIPGRCINSPAFLVGAEVPDILLDFAVLSLPLNQLRKLQIPPRHKASIGLIMVLGSFVGFIGLIRIAVVYRPAHFNVNDENIWLCVQLAVAVHCCCLPTYRPILPKSAFFDQLITSTVSLLRLSRSSRSDRSRSGNGPGSGSDSNPGKYRNLSDRGLERNDIMYMNTTKSVAGVGTQEEITEGTYPLNAIRVERAVDMNSASNN